MPQKRLFCFGFGYTAEFLAYTLRNIEKDEWHIAGTTRSHEKQEAMMALGIDAQLFDNDTALSDVHAALGDATHVLVSTPPDADGDIVFRLHAEDIMRAKRMKWFGYLSTIGVYGDRGGGSVDENSELQPTSIRGTRRVRAEKQWMSLFYQYNIPLHIFRLAGIYGPGRSALDSVRAGIARRIYKEGHAFNRVHVEDIVQTLIHSIHKPNPGRWYDVADDTPAASHEVIEYACELLGKPVPPMVNYEDANLTPMTQSFYSENKRVRNERIKEELSIKLKYPSFREGIKACLEQEEAYWKRLGRLGDVFAASET
ncbi:MAG: SDR family NAD(P)-dependent oxidoreductase [Alphaproteobacteria bacterium]|nr:SDR family NAD(P)-dependent oxidoreductase [Alphaproteobacteria bacterium]